MPFILAGSGLRVSVETGDSIIVTSEQAAAVSYVAGPAIAPVSKPQLDSRALVYGPLIAGEVSIIATLAHVDYEMVRGSTNPTQRSDMIELSATQIANPSAEILQDTDATYKLRDAPYTRYRSDGVALVELGSGGGGEDMEAVLALKADLVDGIVPLSQLPPGVGTNNATARLAATANVTIATGLNSGDTIDGVVLANGNVVLLPVQTDVTQNGLYVVSATPTRDAAYANFNAHVGLEVVVQAGTANAGTVWRCTAAAGGVIGVDGLPFTSTGVADGSISNAKLQTMPGYTIKGNNAAGTGPVVNLTADQMQAMLIYVRKDIGAEVGGTNGDLRIRTDLGGILRERVAGVWQDVPPPIATGEQLYDGTYPAASHLNRARLLTTWGPWTINEWMWSDGTQWFPVNRAWRLFDSTESAASGSLSPTHVILKTLAFPAHMLRGAKRVIVDQEWTAVGTAGTKTVRAYWGTAGAGTGGSMIHGPIATGSGSLHVLPRFTLQIDGDANQHHSAGSITSSGSHSGGAARVGTTFNLLAATEFAIGGSVTTAPDTLTASYSYVEVQFPSRLT